MIDYTLQRILLVATCLFLFYIIYMVKQRKLELHYSLSWLITAGLLIVVTIVPKAIELLSDLLHIVEPVNTIFLVIIFFLILLTFSLTKSVSKNHVKLSALIQETGLLKLEIQKLSERLEQQEKTK